MPTFFPIATYEYQLNPTYEETNHECAKPENVDIFKKFKRLQIAGLLQPKAGDDLYWTANRSEHAVLTDLGQFYLQLVNDGRI